MGDLHGVVGMSKIIITVEYIYEGVMEHEAEQEADEYVREFNTPWPGPHTNCRVKSVQVIHQEEKPDWNKAWDDFTDKLESIKKEVK